jgi:DNA-binding NarL/FixJ family response regulator
MTRDFSLASAVERRDKPLAYGESGSPDPGALLPSWRYRLTAESLPSAPRILHIDPCGAAQESFKALVEPGYPASEVAGAADIRAALALLKNGAWDLVVVEVRQDQGDGWHLLDHLRLTRPSVPVLVLTDASARLVGMRAFRAGAAGWIGKTRPVADQIAAVTTLLDGRCVVPPEIAADLACWVVAVVLRSRTTQRRGWPVECSERLARWAAEMNLTSPEKSLTLRERRVMDCLARGRSIRESSMQLAISPRTVLLCQASILEKMGFTAGSDQDRPAQAGDRGRVLIGAELAA